MCAFRPGLTLTLYQLLALTSPGHATYARSSNQEAQGSPAPNPVLSLPSHPPLTDVPSAIYNFSESAPNSSTTNLRYPIPHCVGDLNDGNLNPSSCMNAYDQMVSYLGALTKPIATVGTRGEGIWHLPNPTYFFSGTSSV